MNITPLFQISTNKDKQQTQRLSFKSNPNSSKLMFKNTDFFISIKGYKKDFDWAEKVLKITDKTSKAMRQNVKFDSILAKLALDMREITKQTWYDDINHTGILRTERNGYCHTKKPENLITPYFRPLSRNTSPYISYKERFDKIKKFPLKTEYDGVSLTRMKNFRGDSIMAHGESDKVNSALDIIKKIYKNLHKKYISQPENVTKKSLNEINSAVAEIRWILAHAAPWERGSDSISNSFMHALYKAMGIKASCAAKGVSFDLQAYCTELENYKKNFSSYFSKPPKVIDDKNSYGFFGFIRQLKKYFITF